MKRAVTKERFRSVGTAVPAVLEKLGVEVVFGIPGNHTVELYRGLAKTNIRHITTRHEQGASFMADGYARVRNKPGVCFLISGPGLLNAATGIVQAQQDGVPMLVVTTCSGDKVQKAALHEMPDQTMSARGLCKKHYVLDNADSAQRIIAEAYQDCQTPSPGVVIVQIHHRVLDSLVPSKEFSIPKPRSRWVYRKEVLAAVKQLERAKQPLVLVGGGARGATHIDTLVERLDAPILNTVNGKGIVAASHPLAVGGSPGMQCLKRAVANADVVLALGTQFSETDYDLLMNDAPQIKSKLVLVDTDPRPATPFRSVNHIRGSVQVVVDQLVSTLAQRQNSGIKTAASLSALVKKDVHYHPEFREFFAALRRCADDFVLVGDSTRPTYYASWMYECEKPGRYFHSVSGFGTLGYAIPAAFGAGVGSEIPVIGLIGDGGAQFTLTELATAVDNKIPVPVIIWQNRGYEEITNSLQARQVGSSSTDISSPDYKAVADAYRIPCFKPRTLLGLTRALRKALALDGPSLVLVDQDQFIKQPSGQWYG